MSAQDSDSSSNGRKRRKPRDLSYRPPKDQKDEDDEVSDLKANKRIKVRSEAATSSEKPTTLTKKSQESKSSRPTSLRRRSPSPVIPERKGRKEIGSNSTTSTSRPRERSNSNSESLLPTRISRRPSPVPEVRIDETTPATLIVGRRGSGSGRFSQSSNDTTSLKATQIVSPRYERKSELSEFPKTQEISDGNNNNLNTGSNESKESSDGGLFSKLFGGIVGLFSWNNGDDSKRASDYQTMDQRPVNEIVQDITVKLTSTSHYIDLKELQLGKPISAGVFGEVYQGTFRGSQVAVKILKNQQFNSKTISMFEKEVQILSKLRHPNIVLFMGAAIEPPKLVIVTEYMPKGSLYDLLHGTSKRSLSLHQIIKMAKDISSGLAYLHLSTPKIIHRDLKPSNLLITDSMNVKICDFGISKEKVNEDHTLTGFVGTIAYMAPELFKKTHYNEKVDIYSLGIILHEMFTGKKPYLGLAAIQIAFNVEKGMRPIVPANCPRQLGILMKECWGEKPSSRPDCYTIIKRLDEIR